MSGSKVDVHNFPWPFDKDALDGLEGYKSVGLTLL